MPVRAFSASLIAAAAVIGVAGLGRAHAEVRLNGAGGSYGLSVMSYRDIPFRTVTRQQFDYSCGSAALATLLRYHYAKQVDEATIFKAMYAVGDQAKIRAAGFSLLDMKRYLAAEGLAADGYRLSLDALQARGKPAVALLTLGRYRHFVVVKGVRNDAVLVGDPATGIKTYKRAEFLAASNGIFFMLHDAAGAEAFNRASEWRPFAAAPLDGRLTDESLEAVTRAAPTLFQVSPVLDLTASLK